MCGKAAIALPPLSLFVDCGIFLRVRQSVRLAKLL